MPRTLLILLSVLLPVSGLAQAPDPSPMTVMPAPVMAKPAPPPDFARAYRAMGKPKLAFLINRKLGKIDYDWSSTDAIQDTIERFDHHSVTSQQARSHIESMIASEIIQWQADDSVDPDLASLRSAFFATLRQWQVDIYDPDLIRQLARRAPASAEDALTFQLRQSKVALLVEVRFYRSSTANDRVQLRILRMNDGQLVAQRMITLTGADELTDQQLKFVATSKGFQPQWIRQPDSNRGRGNLHDPDYRRGVQLANAFMGLLTHSLQ